MVGKVYFMWKIAQVGFIKLRKQEDLEKIAYIFLIEGNVLDMICGAVLQIAMVMKKENRDT